MRGKAALTAFRRRIAAALRPGRGTLPADEPTGTGPGAREGDPARIVGRAATETPGGERTAAELAEATPMPWPPPSADSAAGPVPSAGDEPSSAPAVSPRRSR